MKKMKVFAAFAGYGSQELALKRYNIPFEHVGISEIDKYAIQGHEVLHGKVKNYGDVSKIDVEELPNMDLFTYSFPCQDISNAGKQRGFEKDSGTRSSLLWECERIIEAKKPMFLMMENVKNLVGKNNKPHFDKWLEVLESFGYNNYWKVINAKWCGVPQNRERVFCVSIRKDADNGLFNFYKDFDNGIRLKDILENEVDEKYYLSEEKTKGLIERIKEKDTHQLNAIGSTNPSGKGMNGTVYHSDNLANTITTNKGEGSSILVKEATKKGYKEAYPGDSINLEHPNSTTRRGRVGVGVANCLTTSCNQAVVEPIFSLEKGQSGKTENELNMVGMLDIKGNECIRRVYDSKGLSPTLTTMEGGNRQPKVIEIGLINPNRHSSAMNTIHSENGICRTIDTMQGGNRQPNVLETIDQYRIRKLTPYECFLLMGLTHEEATKLINSGISNSQLYKMAGNSIVVDCMRFLKKLYAIYILHEDKPDIQLLLF